MFQWELEEKHFQKAKEINVEIVATFFNERHQKYVKLKCLNHPHKEEWSVQEFYFFKYKTCGCRLRNYTEDDFVFDISARADVKLFGEYKNDTDKTEFICSEGHIFSARPNKIKKGEGCPECKKEKLRQYFLKDTEWFKEKLLESNPSLELVSDYTGIKNPVTCRCKICGEETTSGADKFTTKQTRCRFCNLSIGESIIWIYLKEHNIDFIPQKTFDGCKNKNLLPFDFYLPNENVCIEFQGEQHFKPVDFSYTPTEDSKKKARDKFQDNLLRDQIKRDYCANSGIILWEITYKQKNKLPQVLDELFNSLNQKP